MSNYQYVGEGDTEGRRADCFTTPNCTYQFGGAHIALQAPLQSFSPRPSYNAQGYSLQWSSSRVASNEPVQQTAMDYHIRVINPMKKRDMKTYSLRDVRTDEILTLAALKEEILDQLGKSVVSFKLDFDVGYMSGNQRICFLEKDFLSALQEATKRGSQLWCKGIMHSSPQASALNTHCDW